MDYFFPDDKIHSPSYLPLESLPYDFDNLDSTNDDQELFSALDHLLHSDSEPRETSSINGIQAYELDLSHMASRDLTYTESVSVEKHASSSKEDFQEALANDSQADGNKRRKRTRNGKQQELNRLAQQRYRERKKEKLNALQTSAEALARMKAEVSALERETAALRISNEELKVKMMKSDQALLEAQKLVARLRQEAIDKDMKIKDLELSIESMENVKMVSLLATLVSKGTLTKDTIRKTCRELQEKAREEACPILQAAALCGQ